MNNINILEVDTHISDVITSDIDLFKCPNCNKFTIIDLNEAEYCFKCGQKIILDVNVGSEIKIENNKIISEHPFRSKPSVNMNNDKIRMTVDIDFKLKYKFRRFIDDLNK